MFGQVLLWNRKLVDALGLNLTLRRGVASCHTFTPWKIVRLKTSSCHAVFDKLNFLTFKVHVRHFRTSQNVNSLLQTLN